MQVYTHTHTLGWGRELYQAHPSATLQTPASRLDGPVARSNQGSSKEAGKTCLLPVAGTAPPTHQPHEGRGRQWQGQGREEVRRGEWRLSGDKGGGESECEAGKWGEEAAAQTARAPAGTRPPGRSCGLCTGQSEAEEPGPQGLWSPVDSKWLGTSRAGSGGQLAGRSRRKPGLWLSPGNRSHAVTRRLGHTALQRGPA